MPYTNVTIPDIYGTVETLKDKVAELEFKLKREADKRNELDKILWNIPEAIKKYGYCDLLKSDGTTLMTLIQRK